MMNVFTKTKPLTRSTLLVVAAVCLFVATRGAGARQQDARDIGVGRTGVKQTAQGQSARSGGVRPELIVQTGHGTFHGPTRFVFSPDARLVATSALGDGNVKLWEVATGRELRVLSSRGATQYAAPLVAFSPDGRLVAASAGANAIKLWEVATGRELRTLAGPSGGLPSAAGVSFMAFGADARTLVAVSDAVRTWDVESGAERAVASPDALGRGRLGAASAAASYGAGAGFALSADGARLAFVEGEGSKVKVRFVETATGRESRGAKLDDVERPRELRRLSLAFANGGRLIVAGVDGGRLKVWDEEGRARDLGAAPAETGFVGISPGGEVVAAASGDYKLKTWDAATGREVMTLDVPHGDAFKRGPLVAFGFSRDAKLLAVGGPDAPPALWDAGSGKLVRKLEGHSNVAHNVSFSPDGTRLLSGARTLWDLRTGQGLRVAAGSSRVFGFPTADGKLLAVVSPNGSAVRVVETATGRTLHTLAPAGAEVSRAAQFATSADGRLLAVKYAKANDEVRADANDDLGRVKVWDVAAGRELQTLAVAPFAKQLHFSADASRLFVLGPGGDITAHDVATGARAGVLAPHARGVEQVAFSRDGRRLATAATDNTIRLWDVQTRRELRALAGHTANVNSLAFSPDGRLLASAGDDGGTQLWDAGTGELLATLVSLFDGGDWLVVTPDGLFDGSPRAWNQILWRYDGDTFNVAPIEWFFNEFYTPGLLADIFDGKRPRAASDISRKDRRQPVVKLSVDGAQSASPSSPITTREVKVRIEVADAKPDAGNPQGSGARDLRLFRNGSLVRVWRGDVLAGKSSVVLDATVPLVAGENRLVAYAFNRDNVKSKDAPLALSGAESLKRAGTLYVLAVGVNEYANPQFNLKYAVADAREFAAEVARQQTGVTRFARTETIALLDRDATKANLLDALRRLSGAPRAPTLKATAAASALERLKPAQPEDAVVVFFAGHGVASGQRFYLVPHDLGYKGRRGAVDQKGLRTLLASSVSDEELEAAFEGLDAGQTLLVIDACNSGQVLEAEEKRRGPMNSKGLAQLAYEKGMYILTAAQSYQAALEAAQLGHGLLTYALVEEGLKKGDADGAPRDGTLLAREWFDYAARRVPLMQEEKMKGARGLGFQIAFVEGEERIADPDRRNVQRPRVFYRRELETNPLIVSRKQ